MIRKFLSRVKRIWKTFTKEHLAVLFSKNIVLTLVYYSIFDFSFFRELHAVLKGKVKHLNDAKRIKANYFLLVRNTHRLEKGLLMKPKRAVFGKEYIEETVDSFIGVWNASYMTDN